MDKFRPTDEQVERGWDLATEWLRSRPELTNSFGERPWSDPSAGWPVTVREHGRQVRLPPKRAGEKRSQERRER